MPIILIVDDEFAIAELLETILSDDGHTVLTASNGRQALDRIAAGPRPDLILTDFMMPVLNGAGLINEVRRDAALRSVPIVVMSSVPETTVRERVTEFQAFLRKPFQLASVTQLIGGMLARAGQPGPHGPERDSGGSAL